MSLNNEPEIKRQIFLVDDHPMIRERLGQMIEREPDLTVCGESATAREALDGLAHLKPHLVIIDISLKDSNGLELIKSIKMLHPEIPVLVLSMHDESLYAERVLRVGARGYITKQEATTEVLAAVRKILSGGVYMSEVMVSRLLNRCAQGQEFGTSPVEALADRELQVLQLIGNGKGTRQIAEELHIGIKTVESYRARIKEKLNIQNGTELVQYAIQWVNGMAAK